MMPNTDNCSSNTVIVHKRSALQYYLSPGKSGDNVNSSAKIAPTAHMSESAQLVNG